MKRLACLLLLIVSVAAIAILAQHIQTGYEPFPKFHEPDWNLSGGPGNINLTNISSGTTWTLPLSSGSSEVLSLIWAPNSDWLIIETVSMNNQNMSVMALNARSHNVENIVHSARPVINSLYWRISASGRVLAVLIQFCDSSSCYWQEWSTSGNFQGTPTGSYILCSNNTCHIEEFSGPGGA